MKTNLWVGRAACRRFLLVAALAAAMLSTGSVSVRAELPAPDNVLYGTITLDGRQMTTNDPAVVVEAYRAGIVEPVASAGIGTANFYTLRIPVEAIAPLRDARASLPGDTLSIVLKDAAGVRSQTTFHLLEPGTVTRLDFGVAVSDADGDGLPDAWEQAMFGSLAANGIADTDGDGASNWSEYLAGTNPSNSNDCFRVQVALGPSGTAISFFARRAAGAGYVGRTRFYSLESCTNLAAGAWTFVSNYANIPAADQSVNYSPPAAMTQPAFFRGRVWLDGP